MEAKVKKQSVPWYSTRWGLLVAIVAMSIFASGLLLGACSIKKIGLLTGEECDANEQCLSNNCAAQGSKSTCQPVGSTKVCNTGNTQSCICSDGKAGNQICDATGLSWGLCTCTGGPTQKCVPNTTLACTCNDGKSGNQTCNADGQSYGSCTCAGGPLCAPGGTQGCICPNGQQGSQSCNADGQSWGICQCQSNNVCQPGGTQACTCAGGGQGSQTCSTDGKSWGICQGCGSTGACTPGATQACTCAGGGQGSQTCNVDGKSWGICQGCSSTSGKSWGETCSKGSECKSTLCIDDPSNTPFCSQRCETTPCPSGYACTNDDQGLQVCGKIQPNAQGFGAACQNLLGCQSLLCWSGACTQRCETTPCPSGYNCVTYNDSLKFCSTGVCNPKNYNQAVACSQQCGSDGQCVAQCQAKYLSPACQDCYVKFVQCAVNQGCNAGQPTCCPAEQKACFGP